MADKEMASWMCIACGWIYDPAVGEPGQGIAPGTPWEDVPAGFLCPECGAAKDQFEKVEF